jgi:hypothetical protein
MAASEQSGSLSVAQRQQLVALLDTFVGALTPEETDRLVHEFGDGSPERTALLRRYAGTAASDLQLQDDVIALLSDDRTVPASDRDDLLLVLSLLSHPASAFFLTGRLTPFHELPLAERVAILLDWSTSILPPKRAFFKVIKALAAKLFFGKTWPATAAHPRANPFWPLIGYPGPDPEMDGAKFHSQRAKMYDFQMLRLPPGSQPVDLSFDAVVIGSGCGGGVMAAELSRAGKAVLVLDKGRYFHQQDMSLLEEDAFSQMYEQQGLLGSVDGSIQILAGSCFGGGSYVSFFNSSFSFLFFFLSLDSQTRHAKMCVVRVASYSP